MMLRPHCQWHCTGRATMNWLFQELCADVRPSVGPTGTPRGDRVWGIRYLIQEYYGQSDIWHWSGELFLTDRVGPSQPTTFDSTKQII
jgi:hypothetical protein